MTPHCIQQQEPVDSIAVEGGDGPVHLRRPDVRTVQQLRHFQDRELHRMCHTRVSFFLAELFHSCSNAQHAHGRFCSVLSTMPARLRTSPAAQDPAWTECVVSSVPCHCPWCLCLPSHTGEAVSCQQFQRETPNVPLAFQNSKRARWIVASLQLEGYSSYVKERHNDSSEHCCTGSTFPAGAFQVHTSRIRPTLALHGQCSRCGKAARPRPGRWAWTLRNRVTAIRLLCLRPAPPGDSLVCARFPNGLPASFPSLPLFPWAVCISSPCCEAKSAAFRLHVLTGAARESPFL